MFVYPIGGGFFCLNLPSEKQHYREDTELFRLYTQHVHVCTHRRRKLVNFGRATLASSQ